MAIDKKLYKGVMVHILEGDTYAGCEFRVTTEDPIDVGTDEIDFELVDAPALIVTSEPTSAPLMVSQRCIDTANKRVYIAAGASSSTDWIRCDNV